MYASGITYTSVASVSPSASTLLMANNGLSVPTPSLAVLGQTVGQAGNPAVLLSNREIPMATKTISLTDKTVSPNVAVKLAGNAITMTGVLGIGGAVPTLTLTETSSGLSMIRSAIPGGFQDQTTGQPITVEYHNTGNVVMRLQSSQFQIIDNITGEFTAIAGAGMSMQSDHTNTGNAPGLTMVDVTITDTLQITMDLVKHVSVINAVPALAIATSTFMGSAGTSPTAILHLVGGTATAGTAPLKFTSGPVLTVPETGAMEYNGTNLSFTIGATRNSVLMGNSGAAAPGTTAGVTIANFYGTSATNFLGQPNNWTAVVIGGVTFKIPLYT